MLVRLIRRSQAEQLTFSSRTGEIEHRNFTFYTVFTTGWAKGAKTRERNFCSIAQVQSYFNKLHIGGYLDDDSYSRAWMMSTRFQWENLSYWRDTDKEDC